MQRYSLCWSEGTDYEDQSVWTMDPRDNGDYVKFADIPPVPDPEPWLDQPDGEGGWKYVPDIDPNEWELFRLFDDTEIGLWFYSSSGRAVAKRLSKGRWQRIPQPTLPVEDA